MTRWNAAREVVQLAERFSSVVATHVFDDFLDDIVRDAEGQPYVEPYVPLVGADYRPGGILVYATAQNLARHGTFEPGSKSMFRLWPGDAAPTGPVSCTPGHVGIQPWDDGLLPALVTVWHLAHGASAVDVARTIAVSNFFKFSLARGDRHHHDLNPAKLGWTRAYAYASLTWQHFVRKEIEALQPGLTLTLRGAQVAVLRSEVGKRCRIEEVNDPSWVKQGMSGAARGSWGRATARGAERLAPFADAIENALEHCKSPYRDSKRPAARIYLGYYLLKWLPS